MPPDLKRLLRDLADAYEREEEGERSQALAGEIAELKAKVDAAPKRELAEAADKLSDEEWELIDAHRAGNLPRKEEPPEPEPKPEEKPEPDRPRQRLTRQIPKIWAGDDEPDHVEYLDEEGAVKVRPGRKRNTPYEWQVDDLEPDQEESNAA